MRRQVRRAAMLVSVDDAGEAGCGGGGMGGGRSGVLLCWFLGMKQMRRVVVVVVWEEAGQACCYAGFSE